MTECLQTLASVSFVPPLIFSEGSLVPTCYVGGSTLHGWSQDYLDPPKMVLECVYLTLAPISVSHRIVLKRSFSFSDKMY